MMQVRRVGSAGNSIAIRIPRTLANKLKIFRGADVWLSVEDGALVVRPITRELLVKLTAEGIQKRFGHKRKGR